MRNHPEFVYAMLAGPVIGAVMVPVDPRSRGERLQFLLHDSGAKAVVVSGELLEALVAVLLIFPISKRFMWPIFPSRTWRPLRIFRPSTNSSKGHWETVPQQIMDVRQPMQIIYTSGTTGNPKGVMIRCNRFGLFNIATKLVWKYKPGDMSVLRFSLTHGNAQAVTLFPSIATGTRAVISPRFTKSRIWDICRKYGCTSFSLLGGMMAGIFNEPPHENDADNPVQTVISAGPRRPCGKHSNSGSMSASSSGTAPWKAVSPTSPGERTHRVIRQAAAGHDAVQGGGRPRQRGGPGVPGELILRMMRGETKVDYLGNPEASRDKPGAAGCAPATWSTGTKPAGIISITAEAASCAAPAISSSPTTSKR